jgi:hypothetical protein
MQSIFALDDFLSNAKSEVAEKSLPKGVFGFTHDADYG